MKLVSAGGESLSLESITRWQGHEDKVRRLDQRFKPLYQLRSFSYRQPLRLQPQVPARLRRGYEVCVSYTDWGPLDAPLLVCVGGVANTAMRFAFLAADLCRDHRVICMDWLGRGRSGWLADPSEYSLNTYVEQLRQLLSHLGADRHNQRAVTLLGSSLGGTAAIEFASRHPDQVRALVLGDIGPQMLRGRRRRRGQVLSRFYVFQRPEDLLRRLGAAQKNDGPVPDDVRRFIAHHQTRLAPEHGGRIYSHDLRALMAYRQETQQDLDQWQAWSRCAARCCCCMAWPPMPWARPPSPGCNAHTPNSAWRTSPARATRPCSATATRPS